MQFGGGGGGSGSSMLRSTASPTSSIEVLYSLLLHEVSFSPLLPRCVVDLLRNLAAHHGVACDADVETFIVQQLRRDDRVVVVLGRATGATVRPSDAFWRASVGAAGLSISVCQTAILCCTAYRWGSRLYMVIWNCTTALYVGSSR